MYCFFFKSKVPSDMNSVPRFSGGYFQNVIFQELYIHFLSNFASNMPYHMAICMLNWTRKGYNSS